MTTAGAATGAVGRKVGEPGPSLGAIDHGIVTWFNRDYGFGFITPDDDGADVFFHISEVSNGTLRVPQVGQRTSYRVGGTPRHPEARTMRLL